MVRVGPPLCSLFPPGNHTVQLGKGSGGPVKMARSSEATGLRVKVVENFTLLGHMPNVWKQKMVLFSGLGETPNCEQHVVPALLCRGRSSTSAC